MERYTKEELEKWWHAQCPKCGWDGLSRDCAGGESIADTGDFNDLLCPVCIKKDDYVVVDDYVEPDAQATIAALQTQLGDLTVKYKNLVAWYDKQNGTPCEQVRHQQEVEALQARVNGLEKDSELLRQSRDDFRVKYESVKNDAITLQAQLTQRTAELEAANNGFAQVRKKTIERVARHGPIMGSRGEYRQGQLDVLESVRRIVQEELYGSHQITG